MTAEVLDVAGDDEQCVIVAECDGWDGRKAFSRVTLYGADRRMIGTAAQVWVELRQEF
jgi:hypothetical protein